MSHLPQYEVQIGVVTGWQDMHHCVAAQHQIRAIHPQPHPIMRIPCETWERGQITELVACPDVDGCLDRSKRVLLGVNLLSSLSLWTSNTGTKIMQCNSNINSIRKSISKISTQKFVG